MPSVNPVVEPEVIDPILIAGNPQTSYKPLVSAPLMIVYGAILVSLALSYGLVALIPD